MLLGLAGVVIIAVLAAALVFRDRIASGISASAAVVFVCLAVVALTAVFAPDLYRRAATASLEQIGVLAQVRSLDDQLVLNDVADVSGDLLGRVQEFLGQPAPAPSTTPREPTRLIEQNLFPGLVSIVAALFRLGALVLSLSGMVGLVALNFAAALYADRQRMQTEVAALQARVASLEAERGVQPPDALAGGAISPGPPGLLPGT
jgi:hypothetical protein